MSNEQYWTDRNQLAQQARQHTQAMRKIYGKEIAHSIEKTYLYKTEDTHMHHHVNNNICVSNADSVAATITAASNPESGHVAVLNFASFKHPGGMYLSGSKAQEECLCHASTLYEVLSAFQDSYYRSHAQELNYGLYANELLYSQDIVFHKGGDSVKVDVITCAAPNKGVFFKYSKLSPQEQVQANHDALVSRIRLILYAAQCQMVDTLILGAFGCGVFAQDAAEVAEIFKQELTHFSFKNVVFAVYGPMGNANLQAFKEVFK